MGQLTVFMIEPYVCYRVSRSAGPGGQHVNKVSTRVTVCLDIKGCSLWTEQQKKRIQRRLATRCDKQGVLQVSSQRHRTQSANRRAALVRLVELLEQALAVPKLRRATRPTLASQERRVVGKKQRGQVKLGRQSVSYDQSTD